MSHNSKIDDAKILLEIHNYVEDEGEKLLKEAEKIKEEEPISEEELLAFQKIAKTRFARKRWNNAKNVYGKVAVACVVCTLVIITLFRTNIIKDVKNTENNSVPTSKYLGDMGMNHAPTYLPDGLIMKHKDKRNTVYYASVGGSRMIFFYQKASDTTEVTNTSDQLLRDVNINGVEGTFYKRGDGLLLVWEKDSYIFSLETQGVSQEEVIKVAESVK